MDVILLSMRYIGFETLSLGLFGFCVWHTLRPNLNEFPRYWRLLELCGAFCFGMLLEWVNVTFFKVYFYGDFFLTCANVPLSIGFSWGVIIYSIMRVSDNSNVPIHYRPLLDALLMVIFDLSIDPIAIRLGMWHWNGIPIQDQWTLQWFGVPYANFFAWICVGILFSTCVRLARYFVKKQKIHSIIVLISLQSAVVLISELILYLGLMLPIEYFKNSVSIISIIWTLCLLVTLPKWYKRLTLGATGLWIKIPLIIQCYFFALLLTPVPNPAPELFVLTTVMSIIGLGLSYCL